MPGQISVYQIQSTQTSLINDIVSGHIDVHGYLERYQSLVSTLYEIGIVCDTAEEMRTSMIPYLEFPSGSRARSYASHESEHAEIAARYGISSKFVFVPAYNGACTVYDLPEKAKDWTLEQLVEFSLATLEVTDPSSMDKEQKELWLRAKMKQ